MSESKLEWLKTAGYLIAGIALVLGSFILGLWISVAYLHTLKAGLAITFLLGFMIGVTPAMISVVMLIGFYTDWSCESSYTSKSSSDGDSDGGASAAIAAVITVCI